MTWIKTIPLSRGDNRLREAFEAQAAFFPPEYAEQIPGLPQGDADGIVAAHSLIPGALRHSFSTLGALLDPSLPLNRRQHELIAAAVSQTNGTRYCSLCHVEFLRKATGDDALAKAVGTDLSSAPLTEVERVIVEYAEQVTRDATRITPAHHEKLRAAGFDDRGILQVTLIAAWFNSINRVADALGVGRLIE